MSDVQKSKEQLQADLSRLVADTKELLSSTADVADKSAKAARSKVEASIAELQAQIATGAREAEQSIEEQLHAADRKVRSNPYASMGISFGVGVVLGLLLRRK